jgi:hypothetical protein
MRIQRFNGDFMTTQKAIEIRRHAGNPKLINIKGLRIVEMPECEGGGYALTGPVAEQIIASLQPQIPEWQPIETAPKDGTWILIFHVHADGGSNSTHVAKYDANSSGNSRGTRWKERAGSYNITATHWMPLPAAPKDTK